MSRVVSIHGGDVPAPATYDVATELRELADRIASGEIEVAGGIAILCVGNAMRIQVLGAPLHTREAVGLLEMAKLGVMVE